MILHKQLLLNCKATKNGRYYTEHTLKSIALQSDNLYDIKYFGILGTTDTATVPLNKAAFRVFNCIIENGCLYGDIEVLNTPEGDTLKDVIDSVVFRPQGIVDHYPNDSTLGALNLLGGNVRIDEDFVYTLVCFNAIHKSKDSLNLDYEQV